ncbi:receptor-activated Ca2+-permeable cation channel [Aureobasidium pullulans]|uniref:Receptor-activated Ca2+-permeable cation channel n=1 Tax=Aureobasidium pullulans TaxID=5580 RepID=A0AB74K441_AURPU|nr:receptor-activated Ca2+-permeable cation channel [Aureobasidium pullulans]THX79872.1 receptor-activated Ca2+-permeable cation channel [Aureobasidium pullulans]TIA47982.1 receptor-activated Ca2+-permeable cation channel [Aureobasidium pullulans]
MDDRPSPSPSAIQYNLAPDLVSPGYRERSQSPPLNDDNTGESSNQFNGNGDKHITMTTPSPEQFRPSLPDRFSAREQSSRSISEAVRLAMSREEQQQLLDDDDEPADDDGCYPPRKDSIPWQPNPHRQLPVYTTIHRIRRLVIACIDDPYSLDQLKSPRMNTAVVRPLLDHLYDPDDVSIVWCLLVNRVQFLRQQSFQAHHQTVNVTRANLCEVLASRILRRFDEDHSGREGLLALANVLVSGFEPFQNAPPSVDRGKRPHSALAEGWFQSGRERVLTALEVAIISESKSFLAASACQKIVDAVYRGRIIYTPTAFIDILPDRYKNRRISLYDPRKAPILNQYRLIVPRNRKVIEIGQFLVLFGLYLLTMFNKAKEIGPGHLHFTTVELIFCVYGSGWVLEELASVLEHGWSVHTENLWAFMDIIFSIIYLAYFGVRMHGLRTNSGPVGKQALDILSLGAPILMPRLAFCLMPENMLFIALRTMMGDFTFLTAVTVWCFGGFLLAMRWLSESQEGYVAHSFFTISKWMLWIWFGLDGTGITKSVEIHGFLGPFLMILFAFIGNTLFLTILVSILSNTYSNLAKNATAEIQFRRAVLTFEGVKSDTLFAYRPPFNVAALIILLPIKFLTTPRWFHKVNVTAVRILNAPLLLAIALYERRYLWQRSSKQGPRRRHAFLDFWESFGAHADLGNVFDEEPPQSVLDEMDDIDDVFGNDVWANGYMNTIRARRGSRQISETSSAYPVFRNRRSRGDSLLPAETW